MAHVGGFETLKGNQKLKRHEQTRLDAMLDRMAYPSDATAFNSLTQQICECAPSVVSTDPAVLEETLDMLLTEAWDEILSKSSLSKEERGKMRRGRAAFIALSADQKSEMWPEYRKKIKTELASTIAYVTAAYVEAERLIARISKEKQQFAHVFAETSGGGGKAASPPAAKRVRWADEAPAQWA